MKLIKLEMQAFGPFKDNVIIDFNNFEQNSLFLITGKTGSGKTTIFDAISYALFGETTGAFRKPENLRSQYASADVDTLVKLVFSSNNKKYLVTRGPSYQRDGKKTKKQPVSILESLDEGKMLGEKASDINKQIEEILGFNAIQFKQIVVLPQGEFIKILNSSSKDRLALLSSILNVDIYNKIQNEIKKDFDEIATKVATSKSIKDSILNTYNVEKLDELEEIYNKKNIDFTEVSTKRLKSLRIIDDLKQSIDKTTENNKNITHYNDLSNDLNQLLADEALYNEALVKITILEKIKEISPIFDDFNKLVDSITQTKDELNTKNNKLKELNPNNESLGDLKKSYEEKVLKLNELEKINISITEDNKRYNNEITKIMKANTDIYDYTNKIAFNERNCFLKKEEKLKLDGNLSFHNTIINAYDPTLLLQYNNIFDSIKNNISIINDIKKNEEQIQVTKSIINENNITLEELTKLKNAKEIILELAGLEKYSYLLKDNEACPLCGSISHPNIIKAHDINKEEINKISEEINNINKEIIKNTTLINTLASNNELLKAQIKEEYLTYSLDDYKEKIIIENKKKNDYDKAKLEVEKLNKEIVKANEAIEGYNTEITKANEAIKGLKANILASNTTLDEILNKYKLENIEALEALNTSNSNQINSINNTNLLLKNKIEAINNIIIDIDKLNVSYIKDKASLDEKKSILESFKFENKNITPRIYTDNDLNEYNSLISYKNNYLEKKQRLTGSIETIKKVITSYEIIDITPLNIKLIDEKKLYDDVNIIYEGILGKIESIKNDISRYKKLEEASKFDFERYEMINELYQLTTGKTSGINKINLEAFVLAKILDDILIFTNNYLLRFTDRRYLLLRDDSAGASDRGLDLSITDNYTGLKRGVGSLSGGGTFMTCLALALGTSEYISNKAGGISLENIFVDEGFGSLDAESLDRAIETLLELACNGKMIGIISHVEDLKLRINQTIEVNKTKSGSTLKINC